MPPHKSIRIAAPARVIAASGRVERLGPLPAQRWDVRLDEVIQNHRVHLAPGGKLVLQVEGGERLSVEVRADAAQGQTYFFHVLDAEAIGHRLMK